MQKATQTQKIFRKKTKAANKRKSGKQKQKTKKFEEIYKEYSRCRVTSEGLKMETDPGFSPYVRKKISHSEERSDEESQKFWAEILRSAQNDNFFR